MELAGKTAIVTGGTKGIGRAIAEALVRAGVNVSISARHEHEITRAVDELNKAGGASVNSRTAGFFCDVRDDAQVKAYFA
ncbi:MAG TPA: SDR family NAD(P)-dependent oxidoreductase, partial [Pyrinomonadaceae bacterium]|nr:SDR family NAD(P)-dependent oxidoreductase [Pyrinomonadaceae bacterium]